MNKIFEFKNGIIIDVWEQFSQFIKLRSYNWSTLHFINFEIEYDRMLGGIEIKMILFGLGLRMRFPVKTDKSVKEWAKINKSMKRIDEAFYGWGLKDEIQDFKNKDINILYLYRTRKFARREAKASKDTVKRLFIQ